MARLGLVVSSQPLFIQSEKHWLEKRLGTDRIKWTYPYRSLLDAGVRVAGASDAPVESLHVLDAIQCAVTREGFVPDQGVSVEEAIRMFTIHAAYAQFEEAVKGSITPGKRADFVVLSANPATSPTEEIRDIRVEETIRSGKTTFQRATHQ
jgi:predicted amidohydrolase YtcJ